jgi:peptidyl-prolyl cis-trans isomerase SurA
MKQFFICCAITLSSFTVFSQTLFTYGSSETSKAEFLRAYNKNKPATADKAKSMREYLDLYTNFKLKVKAAQDLKLDTIAQIKYDVENFREQIAGNYMNDEKGLQALIEEANNRSLKDIHVLYFSVPVAAGAKPEDSLKAYNAAKELYASLLVKGNDYTEVVTAVSSKYFPSKYSDVGFITAFSVPYVFENIIYNTKVGEVSQPYRSSKAWHIFKVIEERQDVGKWKVAQLLFAFPPKVDDATKLQIKAKADSVYGLIKKGLIFADAAKTYSDDRLTYTSGGELPEFASGKYNADFEKNVFALAKDNDVCKPFETSFGYHIVKRLAHTPLPTDKNDAAYVYDLKQKVNQDARVTTVKEKFTKDITAKTGYKKLTAITDADLFKYADSIAKKQEAANAEDFPISKKAVIGFKDGSKIMGTDWLQFVKMYKMSGELQQTASNSKMYSAFAEQQVSNYYKKHLEEYNTDFKYQMQEFKEGNMLFEIMERNVWSKAGKDSAGLSKFYNSNKEKYKWAASADVLVFNCTDEKAATEVLKIIKTGKAWTSFAENSNNQVQADSGRYEITQVPVDPATTKPTENMYTNIIKNADGTATIVKYIKFYPAGMQRSFTEARGLVINDYQTILEQQWIDSLKARYPVKVKEGVWGEMLR